MPVKVKQWLQERWPDLVAVLAPLTVDQEDEIAAICKAEMEYWTNERGAGLGTLGNLVSQTRKHLTASFSLNESNSWLNPRSGLREHLSLKYINLSKEQWAERLVPSEEKKEKRNQNRQSIDEPEKVVERAVSLLESDSWQDIAVSLAVLTGRRVTEVLTVGSFSPRTRFTVTFKGQLKTREKVMPPYEIPVLCEASLVLAAVDRLRLLAGGSPDEDSLVGVADKHFADLVPPRSGGSLYTQLFRSVYGCIAVFYFCKPETLDSIYLNRIYGHYWVGEAEGKLKADYAATLHYQDYRIGDIAVLKHNGQRQGIKLKDAGVALLEIFQEKTEEQKESRKAALVERPVRKPSKTGFSSAKPSEDTRAILDEIWVEIGARIDDDVLKLICKEHYILKTITDYGIDVQDLITILAKAGSSGNEKSLSFLVAVLANLEAIAVLLADAATDSETPIEYLTELLKQKRDFKKSYDTRHHGKDYSKVATSELRKHKAPEAAAERWTRAINAIMAYNSSDECVKHPELRWYINAAVLCELVGGAPTTCKDWIMNNRPDIQEYHTQNKLTPGFNRRGVSITERVKVPEFRVVVESVEPTVEPTEEAATE